jgi:hypothetical protein
MSQFTHRRPHFGCDSKSKASKENPTSHPYNTLLTSDADRIRRITAAAEPNGWSRAHSDKRSVRAALNLQLEFPLSEWRFANAGQMRERHAGAAA